MYEYESRIGFSRCDANGRLSLAGLIDMLQDCSTFQSEDLGVGFRVLEKEHLAWVINYWDLEITGFPDMCESVVVGTFPYGLRGFLANRNFYMKDKDDNFLVKANTMWTLLDMQTVKPVKVPEDIASAYTLEDKLDMEYGSRKIVIPQDCSQITEEMHITVGNMHLDGNKHVNNGQYVKLALAAVEGKYDVSGCKRFKIEYRKQALLGSIICPKIYCGEDYCIVSLNDEDEQPFAVMEIR